jgi:hypothetical protein
MRTMMRQKTKATQLEGGTMGCIADVHVEWAVVNRLRAMLGTPPKTKFNLTQSFALFSAVLLWAKQRAWVGGDAMDRPVWFNEADHAARDAREAMRLASIFDPPWSLSKVRPRFIPARERDPFELAEERINSDFEGMTAEQFIKWLRDALAHGDGRTIRPIHKSSRMSNKTYLTGFEIVFPARKGLKQDLTLSLYHVDMDRIGSILADAFCKALSGGDRYFEQDLGTAAITEAA